MMKIKKRSKGKGKPKTDTDTDTKTRPYIQVRFRPDVPADMEIYEKIKRMTEKRAIDISKFVRLALEFYFDNNKETLFTQ